jgi:hypothetical protein
MWHAGWPGTGYTIFPRSVQSVTETPVPSHHVDLALYAVDTFIITMSLKPSLLFSYLDSYLTDLERWPVEDVVATNASKRTVMLFTEAYRFFPRPGPYSCSGSNSIWLIQPFIWGLTVYTRLT